MGHKPAFSSRQTHQKMEQGLTYLALVLSLVSGAHSYYPNLLEIASSHNRLVFNKNYGQDLTDNNQTGNWTSPGGCIVGTMTMVLSVPTNPNDASKMIYISADPSKKYHRHREMSKKCNDTGTNTFL